ncbi:MAG: hypothetical protein M3R48_04155 [Candidatus Dormibacteraeota bacterium]|nr:hypothetical protein [Candidatus Dormibacteraeota bacterium]
MRNAGFDVPARRVTVNQAPAEVPKEGSGSTWRLSRDRPSERS